MWDWFTKRIFPAPTLWVASVTMTNGLSDLVKRSETRSFTPRFTYPRIVEPSAVLITMFLISVLKDFEAFSVSIVPLSVW